MSDKEPKKKKPAAAIKNLSSSAPSHDDDEAAAAATATDRRSGGDGGVVVLVNGRLFASAAAAAAESSSLRSSVFLSIEQRNYKNSFKIRGGPYGILMALYFHSAECDHRHGTKWMLIDEICARGQPYCDSQFVKRHGAVNGRLFSAWDGVKTLDKHKLVERREHSNDNGKDLLRLTPPGQKFVEELFQSRAADIVAQNKKKNKHGKDAAKAQEVIDRSRIKKKKTPVEISAGKQPAAASTSITTSPPVNNPGVPKKEPAPAPTTITSNGSSTTPKKRKKQQASLTSYFTVTPPSKQQQRRRTSDAAAAGGVDE